MHNFVINLIKPIPHQIQDFQLENHQKTFGGPNPLGKLERFPRSTSPEKWEGKGEKVKEGKGKGSKGERKGSGIEWNGKEGRERKKRRGVEREGKGRGRVMDECFAELFRGPESA